MFLSCQKSYIEKPPSGWKHNRYNPITDKNTLNITLFAIFEPINTEKIGTKIMYKAVIKPALPAPTNCIQYC